MGAKKKKSSSSTFDGDLNDRVQVEKFLDSQVASILKQEGYTTKHKALTIAFLIIGVVGSVAMVLGHLHSKKGGSRMALVAHMAVYAIAYVFDLVFVYLIEGKFKHITVSKSDKTRGIITETRVDLDGNYHLTLHDTSKFSTWIGYKLSRSADAKGALTDTISIGKVFTESGTFQKKTFREFVQRLVHKKEA